MPALTDAPLHQVDTMSHIDLCRAWRFSKPGDPLTTGIVGDYLARRIRSLGGFTPEVSRHIGWDVA
jgi:hypothetical protein